jgi:hypothetical protein
VSDFGGFPFLAFFVLNVGLQEEHPERHCVDTGCIHSVTETVSNVLRKSRPNLKAGCSKGDFQAKGRDKRTFRITLGYKSSKTLP